MKNKAYRIQWSGLRKATGSINNRYATKWWVLSVPGTGGNSLRGQRDKKVMATRIAIVKRAQCLLILDSILILKLINDARQLPERNADFANDKIL